MSSRQQHLASASTGHAVEAGPPPAGSFGRRTLALAMVVFVSVLVVYRLSPVETVTDSIWSVYTAESLIRDGDADLAEHRAAVDAGNGWQTTEEDGHIYYDVPIGVAVVAVPFVAAAAMSDEVLGTAWLDDLSLGGPPSLDPFIASVVTAAAAVVVFLLGRAAGISLVAAAASAGLFALATGAWSTASRALWMHGPTMLVLGIGLLLFLRSAGRPARLAAAGATFGFAFFIRPTTAVAAVGFTILTAVLYRRRVLAFVSGGVVVGMLGLLLNQAVYGRALPTYFDAGRLELSSSVPEALAGNLFSPARGLLVYSPFLAFAVWGIVIRRRSGAFGAIDVTLLSIIGCHWFIVSSFPHWWGGWSYGPRFMTDIVPFLMWFIFPVVQRLIDARETGTGTAPLVVGLFLVCVLASGMAHLAGAASLEGFRWNTDPTNVDDDVGRLWDWSDPPFLRMFR